MTMSVKFCLSYDWFKWDFIALKVDIYFNRKNNVVTERIMMLDTSN